MQRLRVLRYVPAAGLAAILLAILAVAAQPLRTASALTNCTVADADVALDAEEARFLQLINNYRAQYGLGPLTVSANLNRAAAWMALDMGQKNYFSHTDSLGRSPSARAQDCGYPGGAGENLAAGTGRDPPQEAFAAWKAASWASAWAVGSKPRCHRRQGRTGSPSTSRRSNRARTRGRCRSSCTTR